MLSPEHELPTHRRRAASGKSWQEDDEACREAMPRFHPENWNGPGVVMYNNCYAYAFRDRSRDRSKKPQPGERAGLEAMSPEAYTCRALADRVLLDYKGVFVPATVPPPGTTEGLCPCGFSAVYLALDTENARPDYHFYRLDRRDRGDDVWSHKPGAEDAVRVDASGRPITDPRIADRDYSPGYNYRTGCGFMCVPGSSVPAADPDGSS